MIDYLMVLSRSTRLSILPLTKFIFTINKKLSTPSVIFLGRFTELAYDLNQSNIKSRAPYES